jgi:hypothetical protein
MFFRRSRLSARRERHFNRAESLKGINMTDKAKDQGSKGGMDTSKIKIDDAGRVQSEQPELTKEELSSVTGGMRPKDGGICRIQSDPRGCGMSM